MDSPLHLCYGVSVLSERIGRQGYNYIIKIMKGRSSFTASAENAELIMKIRKFIPFFLVLFTLLSPASVYADGISVYVNGSKLDFDVEPRIISDRTFVPMRRIFEALGATVSWDSATQTVTGRKDSTVVNVSINSNTLFKNGVPKLLDAAPTIIDSRTLVPVRAIAESFECDVDWIQNTKTVDIKSKETIVEAKSPLSASEISMEVSPAVFYIEVYDENSRATASGSGFFISEDGIAVTNYHVIDGTSSATITTTDGSTYSVSHIIAYDETLDIAIIRVNQTAITGKTVSKFKTVALGDSDSVAAGETIYAIGSPKGLQNTLSNGIISNPKQVVDGDTLIQITAPISHGSSGGALVNEYGEAIGITSSGFEDAQNIGFAIPINFVKLFDISSSGTTYKEFARAEQGFTLELNTSYIEIEAGKSGDVVVFADGKGDDWSIYWYTAREDTVSCKWGDWRGENNSYCTLTITGLKEGIATVTVYSDVDFKGKDITVKVTNPYVYVYSGTDIPTYTSITGMPLIKRDELNYNYVYSYRYDDISIPQKYVDYLLDNGYTFYRETKDDGVNTYSYITPHNERILVSIAFKWNEVWIYIPK